MHASPSPLRSSGEPDDLPPASTLLTLFSHPDARLRRRLVQAYGDDPRLHSARCFAAIQALERFLELFGDLPCAVYRCPGRISLNPHSDHQGAWVPYGAHRRELLSVVAPMDDGRVEVGNVDASFQELLAFDYETEAAREPAAWRGEWLEYIEAPDVKASVDAHRDAKGQRQGRKATINYVRGAALRLRRLFPEAPIPGLRIVFNGDITQGGGQSSSSTIVVSTALALAITAGLPVDRRRLAEICGEAEWYVGTRGGSGDQSAMLFATRDGLAHLCFRAPVGIRGVRYSGFPAGYRLILANSQTRSEKSAEERRMFNRGIFAYRFAFLALKQAMGGLGLPAALIEETESLGDLHTGRLDEATLYRLLLSLPEHVSSAWLAERFPDRFPAAARTCFDTEDLALLPADIPLRGAAMYGLGRVDRGHAMPHLLEAEAMEEFGRLMTVTHDGDRLFRWGEPYGESRERLKDGRLEAALAQVEAGAERPLRREPGFYGASIAELDRMVDAALDVDGVAGAGLMGAGGGGYVLILAREGAEDRVREALLREYYVPTGREPEVEPWHPCAAAGRLI